MVSGFVTLIIFLLALGGMIFVHEFGHFIAARWAGIEVEEFGFGFPPRAFGFWRAKGFILLSVGVLRFRKTLISVSTGNQF